MSGSPSDQDARRRTWLAIAVGVVAFVPYLRTAGFEFTYDDHAHIVNNPFIRDFANVRELLPWRYMQNEVPDQGRPVLLASHFVDLALGGPQPAGYHVHSAVWHAFTSVLVLGLALRLGLSKWASGAGAALFALHPVHAEAVAGISNREDVLATFFVLSTVLAARQALVTARKRWVVNVALLYALALGSKEVAVVAPLLLALVVACFPPWRPPPVRARRVYATLIVVFVAVTAAWSGFQLQLGYPSLMPGAGGRGLEVAVSRPPAGTAMVGALHRYAGAPSPAQKGVFEPSPWARGGGHATRSRRSAAAPSPAQKGSVREGPGSDAHPQAGRRPQGRAHPADALSLEAFRAWQLVVPYPVTVEHDLRPLRQGWALALGAAVLAGLLGLAGWSYRRGTTVITFGIGWFFAATLPVMMPTLLINPLADRYLYLPAAGVCIAMGWGLLEGLPAGGIRWRSWLGRGLVTSGIIAFAVVGAHQIGVWRNDRTLFRHAAQHAPRSPRAFVNLGAARLRAGDLAGARRALLRARRLDEDRLATLYNLGLLAERAGRPERAIARYREALAGPTITAERSLRERVLERLAPLMRRAGERSALRRIAERELQRRPGSALAERLARQRVTEP